jgi:hypothetical protein
VKVSAEKMHAALAKVEGVLEADEERAQKFLDGAQKAEAETAESFPVTAAERLVGYKEAVGEEVFAAVASNPNLQQMIEEHFQDAAEQVVDKLVDTLFPIFDGTDVTKEEIRLVIVSQSLAE